MKFSPKSFENIVDRKVKCWVSLMGPEHTQLLEKGVIPPEAD